MVNRTLVRVSGEGMLAVDTKREIKVILQS